MRSNPKILRKKFVGVTPTSKRVQLTYAPESTGTIIQYGDEVSSVKFDDGVHRYIPNQHLVEIGG